MYEALKPRQQLRSPSGTVYEVGKFLGAGSQGEVHRVAAGGADYAVKWYLPGFATTEQRGAIETLIRAGSPSPAFLWPIELVEAEGVPGFGYVMPLRDPAVASIVDLMKGRVDPSFRALATASLELVEAFRRLHAAGLCYKDISFGNVFFDPATGRVEVVDTDNVTVDGTARRVTVNGTPRFMAPEIVRNEAGPSANTDLFSLAVLLFYMLTISHPLEGRRETAIHAFDAPAMRRIYGEAPVFIFDPLDASNRPDPAVHTHAERYWNLYPRFLRDLFVRSFTAGLRDPSHGRVREGEWRAALLRLRDAIHYCRNCGSENFAGASESLLELRHGAHAPAADRLRRAERDAEPRHDPRPPPPHRRLVGPRYRGGPGRPEPGGPVPLGSHQLHGRDLGRIPARRHADRGRPREDRGSRPRPRD